MRRASSITLILTLLAATVTAPPRASAEARATLLDFGTGVSLHTPSAVQGTFTEVEYDRVVASTIDLGVIGRPHDRIGIAGEVGYGHAWNGDFTQTFAATFNRDEVVCDVDASSRDYLRVNGALLVDLAGGATRPFLTAGGGIWVFLERSTNTEARCTDGSVTEGHSRVLSSEEDPVLVLGGGVRFRDDRRWGFRIDYRANVVFMDESEVVVSQFRAGVLFTPRQ